MPNYIKSTDFRGKDFLPSGDPEKIVSGAEIDTEFNNIAAVIAEKAEGPVGGGTALVSAPATAQSIAKGWGQAVVALTDAATTTLNADLGNVFTWTIAGNRTLAYPTNLRAGQEIFIIITTSGAARAITYGTGWFKPSAVAVQPNTVSGTVSVLRARANADASRLYIVHFYNDYAQA